MSSALGSSAGALAPARSQMSWNGNVICSLPQRDELRLLLDYVSRLEGPIVFGGDLNAPPSARPIHELEAVASDAYLVTHWVGLPTFPAKFPLMRLDYLFSMNGAVATYAARPDLRVSDHCPILAHFALVSRRYALTQ
jgi:endonuclease/exonuclease/phosphatase (EEP) superfamily protein YafD